MVACGSNANTNAEQKDEYKLNKTQLNLTIGEEYQLKVTKNGKAYSNVTWSSNYSDYCDVSNTGLVSAYYEHTTITITAKLANLLN